MTLISAFINKVISFCLFLIITLATAITAQAQDLDVPFVVTPQHVVNEMLDVANVGPGDYVIDLGSGDGRFVISAAKRGAISHGVDIDPDRIRESNENAMKAGVSDRVMFMEEDIFQTDYSMATVVTMYLLTSVNLELRPGLLANLKPGSRVLTHNFDMGDWEPDKKVEVDEYIFYYWVVPADTEGEWQWETNGNRYSMKIEQEFQQIVEIQIESGNSNDQVLVEEAKINGDRFSLIIQPNDYSLRHVYHGQIDGDVITGSVQVHDGITATVEDWTANRN